MRDSICNDCAKRTRCDMAEIGRSPLAISTCYGYEKGNPTNADRIRAMTDEELAKWMHDMTLISMEIGLSTDWWLQWLKSPVEKDRQLYDAVLNHSETVVIRVPKREEEPE